MYHVESFGGGVSHSPNINNRSALQIITNNLPSHRRFQ